MERIKIFKSRLSGTLDAMPSKSALHREIFASALSEGESVLLNILFSEDITATTDALSALKLIERKSASQGEMRVVGCPFPEGEVSEIIDCAESGSTLRFLVPQALRFGKLISFTGRGKLLKRPLSVYFRLMEERGIAYELSEDRLTVNGTLSPGVFRLLGDESSQYLTGLLFALPLLQGDSEIRLESPLQSRGYVEMTRETLKSRGVFTEWQDDLTLFIPGNQRFLPRAAAVEGDYSHAAFFLVAGALSGDVTVRGLSRESLQGDRAIVDILCAAGAEVSVSEDAVRVRAKELLPFECDLSQIPDLGPVLTAFACGCQGVSVLKNAARLRFKESDRLSASAKEFSALGADITEERDTLIIRGTGGLRGGVCQAHGDHRMAMALGVSSVLCEAPVLLSGYRCVKKSAPQFWREFSSLGGNFNVGDVWD